MILGNGKYRALTNGVGYRVQVKGCFGMWFTFQGETNGHVSPAHFNSMEEVEVFVENVIKFEKSISLTSKWKKLKKNYK